MQRYLADIRKLVSENKSVNLVMPGTLEYLIELQEYFDAIVVSEYEGFITPKEYLRNFSREHRQSDSRILILDDADNGSLDNLLIRHLTQGKIILVSSFPLSSDSSKSYTIPRFYPKIVYKGEEGGEDNSISQKIRVKRPEPTITGGCKLAERYVSKKDLERELIRLGNITSVYRDITREEYEELDEDTPPEVMRLPLHHIMLDLYFYGLNPFTVLEDVGVKKEDIEFIYNLLLRFNCISFSRKITEKGKSVRRLPLGLRNSLLILEENNEILSETILLAALLENYQTVLIETLFNKTSLLKRDANENEDEEEKEKDDVSSPTTGTFNIDLQKVPIELEKYIGKSDTETFMNLYLAYLDGYPGGVRSTLDGYPGGPVRSTLNGMTFSNVSFSSYFEKVEQTISKVEKILDVTSDKYDIPLFLSKNSIEKIYYDRMLSILPENFIYPRYMDINCDIYSISANSRYSLNTIDNDFPSTVWSLISSNIPFIGEDNTRNKENDTNIIYFSYVNIDRLELEMVAEREEIEEQNEQEERKEDEQDD